jgi:hypothetical protein
MPCKTDYRTEDRKIFGFVLGVLAIALLAMVFSVLAPTQDNAAEAAYTYDVSTFKLSSGNYAVAATLLEDCEDAAPGAWLEVRGLGEFSVETSGITTANIQLRGSNEPTTPTGDGIQIGSNITTNTVTQVTGRYRWVKAMTSGEPTGTINVWLFGQGE